MLGLIHSFPRSVCLEAHSGARLDDVKAEAWRTANRLCCDVVFIFNGKAHLVQPTTTEELVLAGAED